MSQSRDLVLPQADAEETGFKTLSNQDFVRVEILYDRTAPDKFRLTTTHVNGDMEYRCSSDDFAIYWCDIFTQATREQGIQG